jgi:hypothetical protein
LLAIRQEQHGSPVSFNVDSRAKDVKPAFILMKAQSVKFWPGEAAAGARETANFLDAVARNS